MFLCQFAENVKIYLLQSQYVNIYESVGRVSKEALIPYPPGIPLVCAGEVISKEAIDIISVADPSKVGGLFLDLNMPNIDGFQVLDYLKENNLFEVIPTSIITGDDSKEAIDRAFKYPIVDMLNKPFNEKEAKLIVQKTINHGK